MSLPALPGSPLSPCLPGKPTPSLPGGPMKEWLSCSSSKQIIVMIYHETYVMVNDNFM